MKQAKKISHRKAAACMAMGCALLVQTSVAFAAGEAAATESTDLDQVVVTANRIPSKLSEAAANVAVVTLEEIAAGNHKTVTDVLKNINGVVFSGQGIAGSEQVVLLNGDSRVVVMVDGRRLNLAKLSGNISGATYDLNSIVTLDNLDRIEVLKGAGSAQYGSDAVGGVINIITRKGEKNRTTFDISQGAWGTGNYNLTQSGSNNGWSWFLTAGKSHQNYMSYKKASTGKVEEMPNSRYDQNNLTFRLDRQLDANSSLTFNFEHADDKKGQPGSIYYTDYFGNLLGADTRSYLNTLSNNVALSYNYKQKADVPAHLRIYQNYFRYDYHDYQHSTSETRHLKHERDIGFDWQDGWRLGKGNVLTAGLEWRQSKVSDPEVYAEDKTVATLGTYLEDRIKLASRWTLTPGVRYDHHNMFGGHFTPRAALSYKADADTDFYVSWGEVFRAPTTDDLFWNQPSWGMIGNPNLRPETGHTTTIGINRKLGKQATLTASYFRSELKDAISWVDIGGWTYQPQNVDKMNKQGFEIAVQTALSPEWKLSAGYSWLKREIKDQYHSDWVNDPNNPAPNGYRLGVSYSKKAWDIGLNLTGASGRDTTKFSSATYWVLDLSANYQLNKNAKLYFKWNNITNQAYEVWGNSTAGSYPMPASNWQIGLKYSF